MSRAASVIRLADLLIYRQLRDFLIALAPENFRLRFETFFVAAARKILKNGKSINNEEYCVKNVRFLVKITKVVAL